MSVYSRLVQTNLPQVSNSTPPQIRVPNTRGRLSPTPSNLPHKPPIHPANAISQVTPMGDSKINYLLLITCFLKQNTSLLCKPTDLHPTITIKSCFVSACQLIFVMNIA